MSYSCSSYHLGIKRNNQLQISMLPTSASETKIALLHHQKEQSMKTVNETTGIVGSKELSHNIKELGHFMLWS